MSNSEKSDEHFILLDVHKIEKRQAAALTTHMSHSAHVSTTTVPGLRTSSTANHDSASGLQLTHQPQMRGTSLPVETTTPITNTTVC